MGYQLRAKVVFCASIGRVNRDTVPSTGELTL